MADTATNKVAFELVTPLQLVESSDVDLVVVPGSEGDFGVLPGHTPFLTTLRAGILDVHDGGGVIQRIFVAGGFAEANEERCTVLADEAVPAADIDRAAAGERLSAARKVHAAANDETKIGAEIELRTAEALVAAAEGLTAE